MAGLKLNILTPTKVLKRDVEIEEVICPGQEGELQVLAGHAPLMTTLKEGTLKYRLKGSSQFLLAAISWGYCEVSPGCVHILATTAEAQEDIDVPRAEEALRKSQERLQQAGLIPGEEVIKWQRKERRAQVRLEIAKSSAKSDRLH